MTRRSMRRWIVAGMLVQLACAADAATPSADSAVPAQPLLTIQQLMDTRIDPAADVLWDSVAFIATMKGEEDRRPRTPAQWEAVRRGALALIEAVDELSTRGRRVAAIDTAAGPGELRASAIQRLIDADPDAFVRRAAVLKSAAQTALSAIDAKDADALMNAGGIIDKACEACHVTYWYPNQARTGP